MCVTNERLLMKECYQGIREEAVRVVRVCDGGLCRSPPSLPRRPASGSGLEGGGGRGGGAGEATALEFSRAGRPQSLLSDSVHMGTSVNSSILEI